MVSPFWRFSSTLWIFLNTNFCQKCSDVFAAPFVQVSQNTKIFQNKKHYRAKLKFVRNTPSYVKMQHENIVGKSHVVLGLFADENRHFSFAGQISSPIWMLHEQFFLSYTKHPYMCAHKKFRSHSTNSQKSRPDPWMIHPWYHGRLCSEVFFKRPL